jgi:ABC-type branched-subunit amino acid transport system substrate-binding protein
MRIRLFLAWASMWLSITAPTGRELTQIESRGKEIYMRGSGAITATLDAGITRIPASALPCASCHGKDGRGRPEGGVTPSDITFEALRRAYEVTTPSGRTHGAYDDPKLRRAITRGIDASNNRLDPVMPRYAMTGGDLRALVSYMKRLGSELDPGISDKSIRLGVILPPQQTMPGASAETRAVVNAWFDEVNKRGGIFGREIEVAFIDPAGTPKERADAVRAFIEHSPVFALACSFSEGAERELSALAEEKQIPFVATITSNPRSSIAPSHYTRELFAGLAEQSRALVRLAAREKPETKRIAIIASGARLADIRDAAVQECRDDGYGAVETIDPPTADAAMMRNSGINTILVLDSGPLAALLSKMEEWNWKPTVLAPAAIVDPDLLAGAPVESYLSFPTLPSDYNESSIATHARLINDHHIGTTHRATQTAALASAALVTDALTRAGRDLSRDALLDAIDTTYAFRSGFAPPLTFRADRHLGSTGCHIIAFEPGRPPKSMWVEIE